MTDKELIEVLKDNDYLKNLASISTACDITAGVGGYINSASGMASNQYHAPLENKVQALTDSIAAIEKRLAILVPDPAKLEKFEALRKAYDHYKMLETMCGE